MNRKGLATTGLQLPELALGTWQDRRAVEPLTTGIALGAGFIDTAESYETEEVVGQAIRGLRSQVFLATKISPRHFRRADVLKAAEASLQRLHTDHVDLYQLHWPNYSVPIAVSNFLPGETAQALNLTMNWRTTVLAACRAKSGGFFPSISRAPFISDRVASTRAFRGTFRNVANGERTVLPSYKSCYLCRSSPTAFGLGNVA